MIKKALGIPKASSNPGTEIIETKLSREKALEIVKIKMPDLNANDEEAALKVIAGTARSMGVETDF